MPTVAEELLRQIASRTAGRKPAWVHQSTVDPDNLPGPPSPIGDFGVDVRRAIVSYVRIVQQLDPARRYSEVKLVVVSDQSTYTVTVNGDDNDYVASPGDDEDDIYAGMANAVNTGGEAANVTATVLGADEGRFFPGKVMKIVEDVGGTGFASLATSTTGGNGVLDDAIEANNVTVTVHALGAELDTVETPGGQSLECFDIVDGLEEYDVIDGRNKVIRLDSAGMAAIYIEPTAADGVVELLVGPGDLETSADPTVNP